MKIQKILLLFLVIISSLSLWSCATSHCDSPNESRLNAEPVLTNTGKVFLKDQSGAERVFTNANVVMWVPTRAAHVWDGHTSGVDVDETTPPGAFVRDYKIEVEIQINDTEHELKQLSEWASSDWYFQEHPELSISEAQYGIQMRKDIWNPEKTRRLLINAMVKKSETFQEDIETAKKMMTSIKLIGKVDN
jgi:hypothetical protein